MSMQNLGVRHQVQSGTFHFSCASTVVMLSAIVLGWFAWLDQQIRDRFDNQLLITVIFIGVLIVVSMLGSLPVGYYSTFCD